MITRGFPCKKVVKFYNRQTKLPIGDSLLAGMQLAFFGTANGATIKTLSIGDGISKLRDGVFLILITGEETAQLPLSGNAKLEGKILPVNISIKMNLGRISNNKING